MSKVSKQRALIALRSFPSVAAAARSVGVAPETLLRMTVDDKDLTHAYENCVHGVIRQRGEEERRAAKRAKQPGPRVSERTAENRKAKFLAAIGKDPRIAAAALHKRLNHERRQEKAADVEEALDALDAVTKGRPLAPPSRRMLNVWDRWCGHCKEHRVDDPCEACGMHTLEVK